MATVPDQEKKLAVGLGENRSHAGGQSSDKSFLGHNELPVSGATFLIQLPYECEWERLP